MKRYKLGAEVYLFSATCEMAVGNGTNSYMAPKYLRKFEEDLSILPIYFAQQGDVVILNDAPSEHYLSRLSTLVADNIQFLSLDALKCMAADQSIEIVDLKPWGWSQVIHRELQGLKQFCAKELKDRPNKNWQTEHRELYSRKTALDVLTRFLELTPSKSKFISKSELPKVVDDVSEVEAAVSTYRQVVVKTPWSSSGRGMIFLNPNTFHKTYTDWVRGAIKSQGYVMLEHGVDKVMDLSFHYEISSGEVRFLGQASFTTADNGQYIGNNIQAIPAHADETLKTFLSAQLIDEISNTLQLAIAKSPIANSYHGVLGVDALVYRGVDGSLKIQPCLEINLRYNMGTLALQLRAALHSEAEGVWKVEHLGSKDAIEFDQMMQVNHPIHIENGKIMRGYLPLIEPCTKRKFALYLLAE